MNNINKIKDLSLKIAKLVEPSGRYYRGCQTHEGMISKIESSDIVIDICYNDNQYKIISNIYKSGNYIPSKRLLFITTGSDIKSEWITYNKKYEEKILDMLKFRYNIELSRNKIRRK